MAFVLMFLAMLSAQGVTSVGAEETTTESDIVDTFEPSGHFVDAVGTYFETTISTYLNITVTSTETIRVLFKSVPGMISFTIDSNSSATSTILSFTGFESNATYYRYQDGYLMENFTTDSSGGYTYTQDISQLHHVLIQEEEQTLYITSDYTFTHDIYEPIVVAADNIVIDGNGYTLQGSGRSFGFELMRRSNVTIKNTIVKGWSFGIYLISSSGITLRNNRMSGNRYNFEVHEHYNISHFFHDIDTSNTVDGKPIYYWINQQNKQVPLDAGYVALVNSTNITVQDLNLINHNYEGVLVAYTNSSWIVGNTITNNCYGVHLLVSSGNTVSGNNITNNEELGIHLEGSHNNTISGNNITNTCFGIEARRSSSGNIISGNNITNNEAGIEAGGSSSGNIISGNDITNNTEGTGVSLWRSGSGNIISGNNITNNQEGIVAAWQQQGNNIISGNTITNNHGGGIRLYYCGNNTVSGNNITNNYDGIRLGDHSDYNSIYGNNITNNSYGIYVRDVSPNNVIYHNNLIDNVVQAYDINPAENNWHHPDLLEGNYWSDYPGADDGSGTGKHAIAGDGIGDTNIPWPEPNYDYYPFTNESGWEIPVDTTPPVIEIFYPEARDYPQTESLTLSFTATDVESGIASITAILDGSPVTSGQVIDLLTISIGDHTLTVTATDNAGNEATSSVTFTVTTTLSGTVTDEYTKEPIQGVAISILETGESTTTDQYGKYSFTIRYAGNYTVEMTVPYGYLTHDAVTKFVEITTATEVNFTLYQASWSGATIPRTIGYWKNWDNHYTPELMATFVEHVKTASGLFSDLTVDNIKTYLKITRHSTMKQKGQAQLLVSWLNVASAQLGVDVQVDLSSIFGWETVISDDDGILTVDELLKQIDNYYVTDASLTKEQWEIIKDILDGLNNGQLFT